MNIYSVHMILYNAHYSILTRNIYFLFLFAQDCHVTLKMDYVDGIRTTVTILTGRGSMGRTTPSGLVSTSIKIVDTDMWYISVFL